MASGKRKRTVELVFEAVDKATQPIQRINRSLESITRPIDRVQRRLRRFSRTQGLERVGRAVAGVGRQMRRLALVGAGAFTAGGLALRRFVSEADNVAKTADKLGLPVEVLQEYRFAFARAGVEQRTFDMGLQRFTRRVAEAAAGTGEARDALKFLGLDLRDAEGNIRETPELLEEVADAIAAIEDPALRVRVAFKLFDSEGVALVNGLQDGGQALRDLRTEANRLGLVMNEETVRAAERTEDSLLGLTSAVKGVLFTAGGELVPLLDSLTQRTTEWVVENQEFIRTELPEFMGRVASALGTIADLVIRVVPRIAEFVDQIGGLRTVGIALAGVLSFKLVGALVALKVALLATPFGLWIAGISAVIGLASVVMRHWEPIVAMFEDWWASLPDFDSLLGGAAQFLGLAGPVETAPAVAGGAPAPAPAGVIGGETRADVTVRVETAQGLSGQVESVETSGSGEIAVETEAGPAFGPGA